MVSQLNRRCACGIILPPVYATRMSKFHDDLWIYHEKQESKLCGQHCLNNLLQGSYFTAPDLADIAQSLDESERRLLDGAFTGVSQNVDEFGNFRYYSIIVFILESSFS